MLSTLLSGLLMAQFTKPTTTKARTRLEAMLVAGVAGVVLFTRSTQAVSFLLKLVFAR